MSLALRLDLPNRLNHIQTGRADFLSLLTLPCSTISPHKLHAPPYHPLSPQLLPLKNAPKPIRQRQLSQHPLYAFVPNGLDALKTRRLLGFGIKGHGTLEIYSIKAVVEGGSRFYASDESEGEDLQGFEGGWREEGLAG